MASLDDIPTLTENVRIARGALVEAEQKLKTTVAAIRDQLDAALGKSHKPRGGRPGVRLSLVEPLWKAGKGAVEIAAETGIANSNVHAAIRILETRKKAEAALLEVDEPETPEPAAPSTVVNDDEDSDEDAATIDQLQAAAKAQRGFMKGKRARLITSARKGHKHVGEIDGQGDGYTTPGPKDGHVHRIRLYLVGPGKDGHRHDLTTVGAD